MRTRQVFAIAAMLTIAPLVGCGSNLPVYPTMSDADALATIVDRQESLVSVSVECDLVLTDSKGERVALDGVLVVELPGKMRLRAWKFGQAVIDLTLVDGNGWVMAPESGSGTGRPDVASLPVREVSGAMNVLGASYFRTAKALGSDEATLRTRGSAFGQDDVACEVDRRTLTPRRFVVSDDRGETVSELVLDEYAVLNGIAWPMRLRLRSPSGEVRVRFRGVALNGEVPSSAFIPPKRAKALP